MKKIEIIEKNEFVNELCVRLENTLDQTDLSHNYKNIIIKNNIEYFKSLWNEFNNYQTEIYNKLKNQNVYNVFVIDNFIEMKKMFND